MKVLLIRPPLTFTNPYQLDAMAVGTPLGILYVAAMLERKKIEVLVFDGLVNFDLDHLNPSHFGTPWGEIKDYIKEKQPDIVGITNHFTEEVDMAFRTARLAKEVDRKILTMIGGPFASTCPEELLKKELSLDIVVMGEGEYTVPEVVEAVSNKKDLAAIKGIAYRDNGKIIINSPRPYIRDLDNLPFPAYHLVDMERYFYFQEKGYATRRQIIKSRKISVITSRGCPFNCTFCCVHLHMGKIWRAHSPGYVLRHVDFLVKTFRAQHILFEDDNINLNTSRFEKILDGLINRDYEIFWDTPNGIRADKLNEILIRKAKKSGCLFLKIGIESGDQYVVNNIVRKHLDLSKVIEVARLSMEVGVKLQAFFIIGFPGETRKEIRNTVNFSLMLFKKFNVISAIGPAKPLIGTQLREICKQKGYLVESVETEEMKKRLIARQDMIATEEFHLDYLFKVIKAYEFRRRLITIEKLFFFCLRKPRILLRNIKIRRPLKRTFNELRKEFGLI